MSYLTGYHLTCTTVNFYEDIDNPIARDILLKARTEMYRQGLPPIDGVWLWQDKLKQALGLSDVQLGNFLLRMNLKLIAHHPEAYLEDSARSMVGYWFPYVTKYAVGNSRVVRSSRIYGTVSRTWFPPHSCWKLFCSPG